MVESEKEDGDARWSSKQSRLFFFWYTFIRKLQEMHYLRNVKFVYTIHYTMYIFFICICLMWMCFQGISGRVWCLVFAGAVWVLGGHSCWAPSFVRVRELWSTSLATDVFPPPHQQRAPEVPTNRKRSNYGAGSQSSLRHRLKAAKWSRLENYWWLPPLCFISGGGKRSLGSHKDAVSCPSTPSQTPLCRERSLFLLPFQKPRLASVFKLCCVFPWTC